MINLKSCGRFTVLYTLYSTFLLSRKRFPEKSATIHSIRKEMKCSSDSEILHEVVCDTSRKLDKHELIRVLWYCIMNQSVQYLRTPAIYFISYQTV